MAKVLKKTTGLTGIAVCEHPRERLRLIYDRILRVADNFPKDYVYRKAVEDLAKERKNIVEQNEDVAVIEQKIGQGQIEEVIISARGELSLMQDMLNQKPWENLMEQAPPNQWTWPPHK
ncbi:NADH dehydrogenase [ubiquinone] 1 alpha subcomplex subunit 5 [Frieseomelitta varia]|uniref:NADH dehydrogenase [ubiquinone] 1 alpha subcomplex subunit 5 n=1 Tax=Frieseomelitta varia TaxID=561572 RepID=UPI001CB693AA|nr:NADH dehydrogenase [ubiquinone] 1 alpha subcomplex subunit 5 [Frieseomelitta varia]